ncbi:MAG: F0F1 ATP synthase subunit B [Verrucomicrobiae bacterium]|nr:F0F1 ATP synthase subunit B [Verrucomicrobiae bacterium]
MNGNSLLMAAADGGILDSIRATGEEFGFNTPLFISQSISFVIVAFLLHKFAYKPILAQLEVRRQKIAEGLANAEKAGRELSNAQARAQEVIGQAGQQAAKIIEEARAAAGMVAEQERQKAIADAQNILAKAREAGDAEVARLKSELRNEFGRLVVQAAARSTGELLTPDQKNRLADDAVRQLSA